MAPLAFDQGNSKSTVEAALPMEGIPREEGVDLNLRLNQLEGEIAVLTDILQGMGASHSLSETLEIALQRVLAVVGTNVGWICLIGEDGSCWSFVGRQGLCWPKDEDGANLCLQGCVCHRVQKTVKPVFVDRLHADCPLLKLDMSLGRPILGHISIPLTAHGVIVGQLNIAYDRKEVIQRNDIDLLNALSSPLGVMIENARLWEEVRRKDSMRAELLKKVVVAQEDERRNIARELHDELGQMLTSLLIGLKVMDRMNSCVEAHALSANLKVTVTQMLESIHNLAFELRPTILDDLGLVPALANYTRECKHRFGIEADFVAIGLDDRRLPAEIETTLYRIVQESLTNVARHAETQKASVLLEVREDMLVVVIEDDGVGFNLSEISGKDDERDRLGLYSMQERARLIGGSVTIESNPGDGTTVFVEVPLSEPGKVKE